MSKRVWMSFDDMALEGRAYSRFEFWREKNGEVIISLNVIVGFMEMISAYCRAHDYTRALVIIDSPAARGDYRLDEMHSHGVLADQLFAGIKVAYVNINAKEDRLVFILSVMLSLKNDRARAFASEQAALAWLLAD